MITLSQLHIKSPFKNIKEIKIDFSKSQGITVLIGNNGSGKSNIIEAISNIFAGLYNHNLDPEFSYELIYLRDSNEITIQYNHNKIKDKYAFINISEGEYLPTQVIGLYSGEELRLWERYFFDFYDVYNKGVLQSKISVSENMEMLFLNKYHWDIALLTMLQSDLELNDILSNKQISTVHFKFDKDAINNVKEFNKKNPNEVTIFTKKILETKVGSIDDESDVIDIEFPIEIFKREIVQTHTEFFKLLSVALLPKDSSWKLITSIELWFTDNYSAKELSEGEKKLLLIKFITRILSDNNSIFLLDEPDSHIHINNKVHIKTHLYGYDNKAYVESILTTHSPTLSACFNNENLLMLNNGQLVDKEKQSIINELTGEFWNKQQQNSFLTSNKPIVIFVEGKHDKNHITNAINVLKGEYPNLDFDIYHMDGACNIKHIIKGLYTSEIKHSKLYLAILDDDLEGKMVHTEFCKECNNLTNFNSLMYPKDMVNKGHKGNFTVENMFELHHYEKAYRKAVSTFTFSSSSINKISENVQKCAKACLVEDSESFAKEDFKHFRLLFDKIDEIWNIYSAQKEILLPIEPINEEIPPNTETTKIFYIKRIQQNIEAKATFNQEGKLITLLKGSKIIKKNVKSASKSVTNLKLKMIKLNMLKEDSGVLILQEDHESSSPSSASSFVLGRNSNGWDEWKDTEGKTLNELYRNSDDKSKT